VAFATRNDQSPCYIVIYVQANTHGRTAKSVLGRCAGSTTSVFVSRAGKRAVDVVALPQEEPYSKKARVQMLNKHLIYVGAIVLIAGVSHAPSIAGTIRDDRSDQRYRNLAAASEYESVGRFDWTVPGSGSGLQAH